MGKHKNLYIQAAFGLHFGPDGPGTLWQSPLGNTHPEGACMQPCIKSYLRAASGLHFGPAGQEALCPSPLGTTHPEDACM